MMILGYTGTMGIYMLLALPFWCLVRLLWLRWHKLSFVLRHEALLALFALFCIALASQTVLPQHLPIWRTPLQALQQANFVPFRTIAEYLQHDNLSLAMLNLAGNLCVFLPFGFLPPLLWRRMDGLLPCILLGAGTSLLIETVQIFIGRSVDIDDLLLNTLGTALGYLLLWLLRKIIKK